MEDKAQEKARLREAAREVAAKASVKNKRNSMQSIARAMKG
jgi:hypothetical protein